MCARLDQLSSFWANRARLRPDRGPRAGCAATGVVEEHPAVRGDGGDVEAVLHQLRQGVGEEQPVGDAERRLPVVGERAVVVHQQRRGAERRPAATALDRRAGDGARRLHGRH